jgi:hypothetical protein
LPRNQRCGRPCRQLGRRSGSIATCRLPHVAGAGPASPAHGLRRKEKSAMHFRLPCILGDYNFDGVSHSLFRKGKSNFASPKCSFLLESGTRKCSKQYASCQGPQFQQVKKKSPIPNNETPFLTIYRVQETCTAGHFNVALPSWMDFSNVAPIYSCVSQLFLWFDAAQNACTSNCLRIR